MFDGQWFPKQQIQFIGLGGPLSASFPSIKTINGSNNGASRTTSSSVTFTAAAAGDRIVIAFVTETNAGGPTAASNSFTVDTITSNGSVRFGYITKTAAGGETSTSVTHGNNRTAWIVINFGAGGAVTMATPATATSIAANPPNGNPGVAANYLWGAAMGIGGTPADTAPTVYPTFYTISQTYQKHGGSAGSGPAVSIAFRQLNASSDDPSAFNHGNGGWVASTFWVTP